MLEKSNRFNLVDEGWIPLEGRKNASLRQVFSKECKAGLAGNAIEKTSILKLLLAIAQSAKTPEDHKDWSRLGPEGIGKFCQSYLDDWREVFWLFGKRPFLQMPKVESAAPRPLGSIVPGLEKTNEQVVKKPETGFSDAEKAVCVAILSGFGLAGRRADNTLVLSPGYRKKINSNGTAKPGRPGTFMGPAGYLHHFLLGADLLQTLWLNLLTLEEIESCGHFPHGVGTPPWESMPTGEDCPRAKDLRNSLIGRLTPMSKFFLLNGDTVHYTDGIVHDSPENLGFDLTVGLDSTACRKEAVCADPDRHPWRNLPELLAFVGGEDGIDCFGIRTCLNRALDKSESLCFWAGGMSVGLRDGEQFPTSADSLVENTIRLPVEAITPEWRQTVQEELAELARLEKRICSSVRDFDLPEDEDMAAREASRQFWNVCNGEIPKLFHTCPSGDRKKLQTTMRESAKQAFRSMLILCSEGKATDEAGPDKGCSCH